MVTLRPCLLLLLLATSLALTRLLPGTEAAKLHTACFTQDNHSAHCSGDLRMYPTNVMECSSTTKLRTENFCQEGFQWLLASGCWDRPNCPEEEQHKDLYPFGFKYLCISGLERLSFDNETSRQSPAVTVWYRKSKANEGLLWHCLVENPNYTTAHADVTLMKTGNEGEGENCTTLKINEEAWLECSDKTRYRTYSNVSTPFSVTLRVVTRNNVHQAWAVVYTRDGKELNISCGRVRKSSHKYAAPVNSSTVVTSSCSSTYLSPSTPGISSSSDPGTSSDNAETPQGSGVLVIAGTVAAVLVVMILLSVMVFFLCKRSASVRGGDKEAEPAAGDPAPPLQGAAEPAPPSAAAGPPSPGPSFPAAPPVAPNGSESLATAPLQPSNDADYDVLGAKRPSTAPRDVTYGHLGMGDVKECDFDHLSRQQASAFPSDDASCVYSTPKRVLKSEPEVSNKADMASAGPSDPDDYPYATVNIVRK